MVRYFNEIQFEPGGGGMEFWTQGVPRRRGPGNTVRWQEVLHKRITARHDELPQGEQTKRAEDGLELSSSAYFYIGRCDPSFSEHVVIFDRPTHPDTSVAPFDTGGFWYDHVVTSPPTANGEKADYVRRHSLTADDKCRAQFTTWGARAFPDCGSYIFGSVPPTALYAIGLDLDASSRDSRCWTWEGRLPKAAAHNATAAQRLFMQRHHYAQYVTWVRNNPSLLAADSIDHLRLVASIYVDAGVTSGGDAANGWIAKNGIW